MNNNEEFSRKEVCSCFGKIEEKMFSLKCVRDNLSVLADGLSLNEDPESCNAILLCVSSFDKAMGELSEILKHIEEVARFSI